MSLLEAVQDLLIGGVRLAAADGARMEVLDPSTGNLLAEVPAAGPRDIDLAVGAARAAQGPWAQTLPSDRGRLLVDCARLVRDRVESLAPLGAMDGGLPLPAVRRDLEATARYLEYYGGLADKIGGEVIPLGPGFLDYTLREPFGVCAVVLPYNSPFQILARSVAPALAAGNAVVAKAADQAPLGPLALAALLEEAGLPAGLVNVLTGTGADAGSPLIVHPGVDRVTFTGSERTGRIVAAAAAGALKPVTVELGGKSPQLVFADADLEASASTIVDSLVWSAGQVCSAGSRVIVERAVHEPLVEAIVERMRSTRVGAALDAPDMGPLISAQQRGAVLGAVEQAEHEGARLRTGGRAPDDLDPSGFFVAPTVFDEVDPGSALAQEEVFGPVLAVIDVADEAEALAVADGTRYGLAAGVWTSDLARAHRVASALRCGQVFVNTYGAGTGIELPFGGTKHSGFGREKGVEGYLAYTQTKNIAIKVGA